MRECFPTIWLHFAHLQMGRAPWNSFHIMSKHIHDFFTPHLNVHDNYPWGESVVFYYVFWCSPCFKDLMLLNNKISLWVFKIRSEVKRGFIYKFSGILT